jgi:hypothetical protein
MHGVGMHAGYDFTLLDLILYLTRLRSKNIAAGSELPADGIWLTIKGNQVLDSPLVTETSFHSLCTLRTEKWDY